MEVGVSESVLNGGWEALDQGRVDLVVGAPGPVPLQKGYRAIPLIRADLLPVIAASHELADIATKAGDCSVFLASARRVITHDTSMIDVARSAGLSSDGKLFYVQNMDQKIEAIRAGIGIGHLPRRRIDKLITSGELIVLDLAAPNVSENFLAWKISNKGKGLQALTQQLSAALG